MREKFAKAEGMRGQFSAVYARCGWKPAFKGKGAPIKTLLFVNVTDSSGKVTADHIWIVEGKQFKGMNIVKGDEIEFDARVTQYQKGYKGHRDDPELPAESTDYKLSFPTRVRRKVVAQAVEQLPLFELKI